MIALDGLNAANACPNDDANAIRILFGDLQPSVLNSHAARATGILDEDVTFFDFFTLIYIFMISLHSIKSSVLKSLTSPAICTGESEVSKVVMRSMPEAPLQIPSQVLRMPVPSGVISPRPVTTTRRFIPSIGLSFPAWVRVFGHRVDCGLHDIRTAPDTAPPTGT